MYPCHRRRTIVSLLPRGRFQHGPRCPPLLIVAAGEGRRPPLPRHSFASAASWSPSLFTRFFPHIQRNRITSKEKAGNVFFYLRHNFLRKRVQFLRFGDSRSGTFAHTNKKKELRQPPIGYYYWLFESSSIQRRVECMLL